MPGLSTIRSLSLPERARFHSTLQAEGTVRALADEAALEIFGEIGDREATPDRVSAALRSIGDRHVTARINSLGGDYFAGVAIYNLLREHRSGVDVQIIGAAASAASIIAMAGETIEIARNAELMIHKAWALAIGNADKMAEASRLLDHLDNAMAETYAERTGQKLATVKAMMAAETWLTGQKAVDAGFADRLLDRDADPKPQASSRNRSALVEDLRALGYAKAAARAIAAGGWPALSGGGDDEDEIGALAALVQRSTEQLRNERLA